MAVTTTKTNKPLNPRGNDQSPKGYNRAELYSGKALDFDGVNDSVNLTATNLDLQEFTIFQNVRLDGSATAHAFYSNYSSTNNVGVAVGLSDSTANKLKFYTKGSSADTLQSSFALNADEWYQVVATYDGATKKIYINGVLDSSVSYDDTIVYTNATPRVGALSNNIQYYDGEIAGVKVYSTALTAAQVADLYNNPEKIVPTGVADSALKLWLPMMEGAGTTAYDGSGNGNHGTISGATWTHGVGSPVAQTAVIDWNKGTNKLPNSLVLTSANYNFNETSFEGGYLAPDGTNTAYKITKESGTSQYAIKSAIAEGDDYRAIYARTTSGTGSVNLLAYGANTNNLFTITEEWQKFSIDAVTTATAEANFYLVDFRFSSTLTEVVLWAPHLAESESVYAPTNGTAQTSDVLLPAGLTSGRDITGVNLFENVRKQGALNLDGNSWAEVHDNASLDITDAITLEAWVWYLEGDSDWAAISKYQNSSEAFMMFFYPARSVKFFANGGQKATTGNVLTNNAWNHVVITYDKTNVKIYIDGNEEASTAYTTALTTTSKVVEIGRYWGSNAYGTDGSKIAQPRIYNRALTAEEVQRNYDAGKNIYK